MSTFKIATFNIHMWRDGSWEENMEEVTDLVKQHDPDVLCLQETTSPDHGAFLSRMHSTHPYAINYRDVAILSRFPMEDYMRREGLRPQARQVTGVVTLPGRDQPVYVTCLHLDYRAEPNRLLEVESVRKKLVRLFEEDAPQIWTGDFNALTREDYDEAYWEDVYNVRRVGGWELPKVELTGKVKNLGFVDCWSLHGRPRPAKTCRYDTRIDYVYASPKMLQNHELSDFAHISTAASDHNMAVAQFKL